MNDSALNVSLAKRARQLSALARVKRDDRHDSQTKAQVQTALNRLDQGLISLDSALGVYRKLKDIGVPVTEPPNLEQPAKRLKEETEVGRPAPQFLQARCREVDAARTAIDAANTDAWQNWASQVIRDLPEALLPRVHFARRNATKTRISAMKTLAAKRPSIPDIIQFSTHRDSVNDEFDEVADASIDSLLERFKDGQIRLADLSDEDLELLRGDASLDDQLYIRIRS